MLVTLASFRELQEAHMLAGRLASEGIFTDVAHGFHVSNNWAWSTALFGAKVQVSDMDWATAKLILDDCRAGRLRDTLQSKIGDLDDRRCPHCGSGACTKRRPYYQVLLSALLLVPAGILPPWRWNYVCEACGTQFKQRYGLIGKTPIGFEYPMEFAEASHADIAEAAELSHTARDNAPVEPLGETTARFEVVLDRTGKGWVCRVDGVVRGFSLAEREGSRLVALYVHPDFQRWGFGRRLHNEAVDWLFANGPGPLRLAVDSATKACRFFHAAGWRLVDQEANGDHLLELTADAWIKRKPTF